MSHKFTKVSCIGSPYEIGFQHGQSAKEQVHGSISFYTKLFQAYSKLSWDEVRQISIEWKEPIKNKWPRYHEEMQGLADASGCDILDIIALNIRTEIAFGRFSDGCTSLYWKTENNAFLAQNWDWMEEQKPNLIILNIKRPDYPCIQMVTEAGIIGKIGFNEDGVGVCLNAIKAPGYDTSKLPVHLALRMVLDCRSADEAIQTLEECGVAASSHLLVADASRGTGMEFTRSTSIKLPMDEKNRVFHTNHLIKKHEGVADGVWLVDSTVRLDRIQQLADHLDNPDYDEITRLLDDHEGFPLSICRYEETAMGMDATVFSIVMDLHERKAIVKLGRPCVIPAFPTDKNSRGASRIYYRPPPLVTFSKCLNNCLGERAKRVVGEVEDAIDEFHFARHVRRVTLSVRGISFNGRVWLVGGDWLGKSIPVVAASTSDADRSRTRRRITRQREQLVTHNSLEDSAPTVVDEAASTQDASPDLRGNEGIQTPEGDSPSPSLTELLSTSIPSLSELEEFATWTSAARDTEAEAMAEFNLSLLCHRIDFFNIPDELKFILNYHLAEVIPKLCVDNSCKQNPYSQYIFPLAMEVPSLLYSCAALAACHFNVRLSNGHLQQDFFKFKGKSIKRLQEDLYSQSRAKHPGCLATILMLCLSEICQDGFSNFETHFKGARRLIELRGWELTEKCFVEQYLAWFDLMSAASHSRHPVFSAIDIQALLGEGMEWSFDVFPCPTDQFQILCRIVALYKSQHDLTNPAQETLEQLEEIKFTLMSQQVHSERGRYWLHLTEAYRFAIILYLLRLFKYDCDTYEIDWLTSSVIYHAKSIPDSTGWSNQLLWPLFHAGLEINDEMRRNWVRERARSMQFSGGFGNVQRAVEILELVWAGCQPGSYFDLLAGDGSGNMLLI